MVLGPEFSACLLARRAEWLVDACLAAALLLPAVAAVHGIVLAALHVENAVDLDIYGAFQLCSIGILAAPVTVMISRTYFNVPGRNTIFIWILLILVGLVCLTVEFYRVSTIACPTTADGTPVTSNFSEFLWGNERSCNLSFSCSVDKHSPVSPMRGGAANNVYIIPEPDTLTFGTTTLLAAACSVHALLCLVTMWNRVIKNYWKRNHDQQNEKQDERVHEGYPATKTMMKKINGKTEYYRTIAAIPVFGGVGLTVLVLGECNLWSRQMKYETEPIASVGQWAPICGTAMAVVGSLYAWVAADVEAVKEEMNPSTPEIQCDCPHRRNSGGSRGPGRSRTRSISRHSSRSHYNNIHLRPGSRRDSSLASRLSSRGTFISESGSVLKPTHGSRHKVAETLIKMGKWLGNPTEDYFEESGFTRGKARQYPEIPGERNRNSRLREIRKRAKERSKAKENRASSVAASITQSETSHCSSDHGAQSHMSESHDAVSNEHEMEPDVAEGVTPSTVKPLCKRQRRDTLEVPPQVHHQ